VVAPEALDPGLSPLTPFGSLGDGARLGFVGGLRLGESLYSGVSAPRSRRLCSGSVRGWDMDGFNRGRCFDRKRIASFEGKFVGSVMSRGGR
jgi:hypothetical protein